MFICVSPNPAIDKRMTLASLVPGQVNRARATYAFPGGKSTHVAMVLHTLGEAPQWIGLCGGATGAELVAGLSELGILTHACTTSQQTRTNLELIEDNGKVTEILEPGCTPTAAELVAFENTCDAVFSQNREQGLVIFSGSLPGAVSSSLYARLVARARQCGCRTFLDTSGEPLRLALAVHPHFVKPNRDEAGFLLGTTIDSVSDAAGALRKLLSLGACSAALSLGADGLLFCAAENAPVLFASALSLEPRSTVGCGDSAVAGFAHAMASKCPPEDVLRFAAACATANCLADAPGAARLHDIRRFQSQIRVQTLPASP